MSDQISNVNGTANADTVRRPSAQQQMDAALADSERRGSLDPTPNPRNPNAITTENASKSEIPPTSSVATQNAPGRAGSIGEAAMGALGYGGAQVERPKEEQGLGEKIVNFLGA